MQKRKLNQLWLTEKGAIAESKKQYFLPLIMQQPL